MIAVVTKIIENSKTCTRELSACQDICRSASHDAIAMIFVDLYFLMRRNGSSFRTRNELMKI